jgi:hypothetical protein
MGAIGELLAPAGAANAAKDRPNAAGVRRRQRPVGAIGWSARLNEACSSGAVHLLSR